MENDNRVQVLEADQDVYSVIEKITRECDQRDAFYVCDVSELIWLHNNWMKLLPRVEPYYAVKCNDSRTVLETLAALGVGFDCASKEEIRRVLSLGVEVDRVIYAHPTKIVDHLNYAAEVGVRSMTFDNEAELYKIKKYYPEAELVLRIKCDDVTAKYVLGKKFGAHPDKEAKKLLAIAKSLELNVIGVAFHVGSGCSNYAIFSKAIETARSVFDMAANLGYEFKLLDVGGGFPGRKSKPIDKLAEYINKALEKHFPDPSIRIIAEPGTYYVNSAYKLIANIHSKRFLTEQENNNNNNNNNGETETAIRMYYVDTSIYGALIPALFQEFYECRPVELEPNSPEHASVIWGSTCDSTDKISDDVVALPEMEIGEWIIFENAGAYTLSISCEFNGFRTPDVHVVVRKEDYLLLTENLSKPLPKERFVTGNELNNFLTGLRSPYKFRRIYF